VQRYAVPFASVAVAVVVRVALRPWLGSEAPYIQFYPAIMLASWYGGWGPGILATALSATAAIAWLLGPLSLRPSDMANLISCVFFVIIGVLIAGLNESFLADERRHREIADRLRARYLDLAELATSRLAAIVESSEDAVIGKDLERRITSWNRGAERLFGYSSAEAIGRPITTILPDDRLDEEEHVLARIRAGERVEPFETERRRRDGTTVAVSVSMSPIRSPAGTIVGTSVIARDITERRRSERLRDELLERERAAREDAIAARDRLQFLAEVSATLGASLDYERTLDRAVHLALPRLGDYCNVLVADEHGHLHPSAWGHVNPEKVPLVRELTMRLFETPADAGVPTFASEILRSGKPMVVSHEQLMAMATQVQPIDPELVAIGTALRPYAYIGAPLIVRRRVVGAISFGRTAETPHDYGDADVELFEEFARRVSIAVENARLFRQADELNRLKDEFLATVSHELRTPLSAILGWSRLLSGGQLDSNKTARAVDVIERNAQLQSKLVDDILDVARGIAGNVRLDVKPLDLGTIAHRGADAIAPTASAKHIRVEVVAPAPVIVTGDVARLQQVVWNLLTNAVKFTPGGGRVSIAVSAENGFAELRVSDTGSGIPPNFLPYVFDKFRQADASFTRQYGGLGLGLAIARHLVELHGGAVEARSEGQGKGATFIVQLPAA